MHIIIDVILPIIVIVLIGWLSQRKNFFMKPQGKAINRFVFYYALPALLFITTANEPIKSLLNFKFFLVYALGTILTAFVAIVLTRILFQKRSLKDFILTALNSASTNAGYIGIPILTGLLGIKAMLPIAISLIFILCIWYTGLMLLLELIAVKDNNSHFNWSNIVFSLLKNPLFVGPLFGILYSVTGLPLPKPIHNIFTILSAATVPCVLFIIGLNMNFSKNNMNYPETTLLVFAKMIIHPLITLALVKLFHISSLWAISAVIIAALPTGKNVFVIAEKYEYGKQLSSSVVVWTTILSVITTTGFILLMT